MHQREADNQYMSMTHKNLKNRKNNNLSLSNLLSKNRMMMIHSSIMVRNKGSLILEKEKTNLNLYLNHKSKNKRKNHVSK
jgi:hypothetical protein